MKRRTVDLVLYGTVLVVAIGAGAWAIANRADDTVPDAAPVASPEEPAPEEEEAPFVPDLPEVPDLATEPPPARPATDGDPRIAQLSAEMRIVSRARELLGENPGEALAVLEEHRRHHADGILREEREAFAIEALVELERRPEAERRYYDFQRTYPHSDFSRRLADMMR